MPVRRSASDKDAINVDVIAALARETNRPLAEVERVFASEFERLQLDARVTDYLVLFASRRARESLRRG